MVRKSIWIFLLFSIAVFGSVNAINETCSNLHGTPNPAESAQSVAISFFFTGNATGTITCNGAIDSNPPVSCYGNSSSCTANCVWGSGGTYPVEADYGSAACNPFNQTINAEATPTPTPTPSPTPWPTCSNMNGTVCALEEICPADQWLNASDSERCCAVDCEANATPTPSPTVTPTPTPPGNATESPTPSLTPTPTLTPIPTNTPTPSPTNTPVPTEPHVVPSTATPSSPVPPALEEEIEELRDQVDALPEGNDKQELFILLNEAEENMQAQQTSKARALILQARLKIAEAGTYKTDRSTPISYAEIAFVGVLVAGVVWAVSGLIIRRGKIKQA
ncbi:hypothetical protein KJ765_04400 [Candidatus Micrarchaeota archaeon]|nr:hypothetical protein [Candidatus Micrarchaeota archaeon]